MQAHIVEADVAKRIAAQYPDSVLIFNPSYVLSKDQAIFAAILAKKAFESGQNIANKLAIEFLVRLSGQKKIQKALQYGPRDITDIAGIVIVDDGVDREGIRDVPFHVDMEIICRKYGVSPLTAKKEIYEKMAMVDV